MGSIEKPRISKATLDKIAESHFFTDLKRGYLALEKENKELKEEIEELKEYRKIDLEELKNFEKEREQIFTECVKLKNLVEQLRDAIEEPKELADK